MKTFVLNLYHGFGKTKAVLVGLVLAAYLAMVQYSGGSALGALWFWGVCGVYVLLPGMLWATLLRTGRMVKGYFMPLALLLGSGFFAVLYCFAMRLSAPWLLHVVPPAFSLAYLGLLVLRKNGLPRRTRPIQPQTWLLVLLTAALVLLYTFKGVAQSGWPSAVGDVLQNKDLLWNVGNTASFTLGFPPVDIRFAEVRLHYHYLTELLAGALSIVSRATPYDILAFYLQPLMLAAMVMCLYHFARLLWPNSLRKAMLFVYSLFLFGCASLWKILWDGSSVFSNSHITHLVTNINGVTTSVVFLTIFFGLFIAASRKQYRVNAWHLVLLLVSFVMLIFSKGPLAALVTVAVVLVLLVGLPLKQTGWRGLVLGVVLGALFLVVYQAMFASGANDSMPFSWYGTLEKGYFYNILQHIWRMGLENTLVWKLVYIFFYLLQSLLMAPAAFILYLASVVRDVRRFKQLKPERLLFQAMAVGGLLAFFLFNHPHMSQVYFLFGGLFCMHILAVDSIDLLRWKNAGAGFKGACRKGFTAVVVFFAAVGLATTGFLYTNMLGSGYNQLMRNLGVQEKYPYMVVMNADDEAAALYLRDNTEETALFATNRIHSGWHREGVSNIYSAWGERQAFMEGFQYAKTNMGVSEAEINRRLTINTALFDEGTLPGEVARLMQENGIGYLVYSTQVQATQAAPEDMGITQLPPGGQFAALELVFQSETAYIYRLPEEGLA